MFESTWNRRVKKNTCLWVINLDLIAFPNFYLQWNFPLKAVSEYIIDGLKIFGVRANLNNFKEICVIRLSMTYKLQLSTKVTLPLFVLAHFSCVVSFLFLETWQILLLKSFWWQRVVSKGPRLMRIIISFMSYCYWSHSCQILPLRDTQSIHNLRFSQWA